MSTSTAAGVLLIGVPLAFNVAFGLLAARFDYPDILRRPTDEVLARFREGGRGLMLVWWGFMLTAVLLAPPVAPLTFSPGDAHNPPLGNAPGGGGLAAPGPFA